MKTGTLRVFCDVIETGSFTEAAKKNKRSIASVSLSFQQVENHFGVQCAIRDPLLFQVTTRGGICYDGCRKIVLLHRALERAMQRTHEISARTVTLAACFSFGLHRLPPILGRFRQTFPHLRVHDRYAHIDRVHHLVLNNAVDIGLVAYPRRLAGLAIHPIRPEPLVLVCHPQHSLIARRAVPVTALRNHPIIAWKEIPWVTFLKNIPDSHRHFFEPRHEFNEVEMVKQAVEKDAGIAVLPEGTVQAEVSANRLASLPFENGKYSEPLAIIHRKNRKLTPPMQTFIDHLKQAR